MTCFLCGSGTNTPALTCNCQTCMKVAMVDAEIKRAVATLQRLLIQRCDLRSEQNHAHDIMRRLPLELKNRIFELVLPTRDEWGSEVGPWPRGGTPSYLTSICKNWRDIARSNPFLWSTVPIVLGTPSKSDPSWVDFVDGWIQRSRNSPLSLHITVYDGDDDSEDDSQDLEEQLNGVLSVMCQYPNEWQSLSLEIPFSLLYVFHDDNDFKSHLLTVRKLRIICTDNWDDIDRPVYPVMSPEKIEIDGLTFKSLRISWNHLTSAKVINWNLEEVTQLFQHASQMVCCSISWPRSTPDFTVPPIIHQKLQTLNFRYCREAIPMLLDSLTFPCLRAIETDIIFAGLPSLLHRSSCSPMRITLFETRELPSDLQPLPRVTDLVLGKDCDGSTLKELLLEGYFPDLLHLTLPLPLFIILWKTFIIPMLLDRNQPRPNGLTLRNIFVVGPLDRSNPMWDSEFGKELKAFQSSICLREDGFDFLLPEVLRGDEDS